MRTFLTNGYQNQSHVYSTCLDVHNNIFSFIRMKDLRESCTKGYVYTCICAQMYYFYLRADKNSVYTGQVAGSGQYCQPLNI